MDKLYYCVDCKRIVTDSEQCGYCKVQTLKR